MLIVCPNCATSYRIEPSSLGAAGRSVRCVRCRSVWVAHDSAEFPATEELARDGGISLSASFAALDDPRDPSDPRGPHPGPASPSRCIPAASSSLAAEPA